MAIVARTTSRSVKEASPDIGSEELRRTDTSGAFGAIGASKVMAIGQDMSDIAENEMRALEERDRVRMMAELSEFEIESIQRVNVLETEGTGDKPFVKGVMEDSRDRTKKFLELQPEFLRGEAAVRLLPIQTKVAKSAIATQQIRIENENSKNAETYRNAVVNQVRYGQVSEETALAKAASFADKLPDTIRDKERARGIEEIRTASLKAKMQADTEGTLKDVEAGKYNDVPNSQLDQIYAAGARSLEANKNKTVTLKNKAVNLAGTDPAQAAMLYWQALDVIDPTREEILYAQTELGIPEADQSLVTKTDAQSIVRHFSAVQNVDEFLMAREEFRARAEEEGHDASEMVEDVSKLASMPMALRLIFDADQRNVPEEFLAGAIDVIRNPKTGEDSRKQIGARAIVNNDVGTQKVADYEKIVFKQISDELEAMVKSGVGVRPGEGTTREFTQAVSDIAAVVYNNAEAIGEDGDDAVKRMLKARNENKEIRTDGADGYVLPLDLATAVSEEDMDGIKKAVIRDLTVIVATGGTSFPDEQFAKEAMIENSGWTMHGNRALILRAYGMPVLRENKEGRVEPVTITFDQLAVRKRGLRK